MTKFALGIRALLRQPLFHFLLAGAAIFALDAYRGTPGNVNDKRIIVRSAHIARLADQWQMTWGRQPEDEEIQSLVRNYIKEEIYYREAIRLGLDVNDSVIRQRLGRKIEFMLVPELTAEEVSDEALTQYFEQHVDRYLTSPVMTIEQVYFSSSPSDTYSIDTGKSRTLAASDSHPVQDRISRALEQLRDGAGVDGLGDVIGLPHQLVEADKAQVVRTFGSAFYDAVLPLQPGVWTGPVTSGFGLHLVKVNRRQEARVPNLSEVRAAVVNDWLAEQNTALQHKAYEDLRSGYDVIIDVSVK